MVQTSYLLKRCIRDILAEHDTDTGYCLTIIVEPETHNNVPRHWFERKSAWDTLEGIVYE